MAVVEYFYATHSVYAYLGASKFIELTSNQNHEIIHKPFNLSEAIIGVGSITIGERNAAHLVDGDMFYGQDRLDLVERALV